VVDVGGNNQRHGQGVLPVRPSTEETGPEPDHVYRVTESEPHSGRTTRYLPTGFGRRTAGDSVDTHCDASMNGVRFATPLQKQHDLHSSEHDV
jgi:hypothetical protein